MRRLGVDPLTETGSVWGRKEGAGKGGFGVGRPKRPPVS